MQDGRRLWRAWSSVLDLVAGRDGELRERVRPGVVRPERSVFAGRKRRARVFMSAGVRMEPHSVRVRETVVARLFGGRRLFGRQVVQTRCVGRVEVHAGLRGAHVPVALGMRGWSPPRQLSMRARFRRQHRRPERLSSDQGDGQLRAGRRMSSRRSVCGNVVGWPIEIVPTNLRSYGVRPERHLRG